MPMPTEDTIHSRRSRDGLSKPDARRCRAPRLGLAEHPREDRVDMLEMMVEVEIGLDLGR